MSTKRFAVLSALAAVFLLLGMFVAVQPAPAASVTPEVVVGNPDCSDLGYDFGFKPQPEPPPTGTYSFPDGINTVTITSDGTYFDWSSTLGIDAVIVKGGNAANVFRYDPEAFNDTGLVSPNNASSGPADISHIEFCYDYEVDVSKTADTAFTRTFAWTIDKSVTPEVWNLFTGDSGSSKYMVEVIKDSGTDSDWAVSGTISIDNNTPFDAKITGISDVIDNYGAADTINCDVTFPYTLAAGAELQCIYSAGPDASSINPFGDTNTAIVTTNKTSDNPVGGGEATADVTFGEPTTVVNNEINVADTNGQDWGPVSDNMIWTYDRIFTCGDEGENGNTATILETGQSDDASVTVNCYALTVAKDADTSFTRTYNWTIDKSADQNALTLSIGQQFLVNYSVLVDATYTDSAWAASGNITVSNPAPIPATLSGVADVVSLNIAATTVNCGVSFPYELAAGGTLNCTYNANLPDATSRTNTATATLQNYSYADGIATADGTTDFSGTADVTFSDSPTTEMDECIDVSDTITGSLGTVCYSDVPKTFTYEYPIGPYDTCGVYTVENTASFVTKDTGAEGSDSWTVDVDLPCVGGCTLTPGYWKTHSKYGPAPYDDTWEKIGEDTSFFLSGQSYYEILWTNPQGGNAYYILAHAYIAAELNGLNGADTSAITAEMTDATALFATYTPDDVAAFKGKDKVLRDQFIDLATTLDAYNNGLIGPGHCSE